MGITIGLLLPYIKCLVPVGTERAPTYSEHSLCGIHDKESKQCTQRHQMLMCGYRTMREHCRDMHEVVEARMYNAERYAPHLCSLQSNDGSPITPHRYWHTTTQVEEVTPRGTCSLTPPRIRLTRLMRSVAKQRTGVRVKVGVGDQSM